MVWRFQGGFALTNRQEARNSGSETLEDIRQVVREDRVSRWGFSPVVVFGVLGLLGWSVGLPRLKKRVAPKGENHVHVLEDMYIPSLKLT